MPTPTPLPTLVFDGGVTYGDFTATTIILCIDGLLVLGFVVWMSMILFKPRRPE